MHVKLFYAICVVLLPIYSCHKEFRGHLYNINNNVCKKLSDKVVLYAIFVDTKTTQPWSTYDINSTIDSIHIALKWLEKKASESGISLKIELQYHQNKHVIPLANNLPNESFRKTLVTIPYSLGMRRTDSWANKLAQDAGKSFSPDTSIVIKTKNELKNRERLIAKLRDKNSTDNIALVYFLNNYYKPDLSAALHTGANDNEPEYAVVSFKTPGVIAHEFLHLFGALDLYASAWDTKKTIKKRKAWAMKEFPKEIMAFPYRQLDSLEISPYTKFMISWTTSLEENYRKKILGKNIYPAQY